MINDTRYITESDNMVRVELDTELPDGTLATVIVYLTTSYVNTTGKQVISNYLTNVVDEFVTREGVFNAD